MVEHIVTADEDGSRADRIVKNVAASVSYAFLQKLFRLNKVKSNGKKISASDHLKTGDILKIYANLNEVIDTPKRNRNLLDKLKSMIIFENEDFFAINKPAKLAVQSGSKILTSVDDIIKAYPNCKCHLVHRLDQETSGVLLIAKNQRSARHLTELFRKQKIYKTYLAIVDGKITEPGRIDNFLEKSFVGNEEKMRVSQFGQKAITLYKPIKSTDKYTLLELQPLTGRKHQLRVHCANVLNAPILGDQKYNPNCRHKRLFLYAHKLSINELGIEIIAEDPEYLDINTLT